MAMKALDIYKNLPKTNCKKCGYPTCLAFAMKLAVGKAEIEACPDLDPETKTLLGGVTRPPVRLVQVGAGERSVAIGEEFVLFRHEKTFYHPPGIMVQVSDAWPEDKVRSAVEVVRDTVVHRVGQDLVLTGVAVKNESNRPDRFAETVALAGGGSSLPLVLIADDPASFEAALAISGHYRPLIHAATGDNWQALAALAKRYGCPLAVRASGPAELAALAGKCADAGAPDLVLDPAPRSLRDFIAAATEIRRAAVGRTEPALGYPLYLDAGSFGEIDTALAAGILKYAGIIVTPPLSPASREAALTLRQNIYTDPQKPIQVTPGIYPINEPGPSAPVLLTVNFSLTYFTLLSYLDASRIPCYLFVADTEGLSVLTAVAGGKLTETLVADSLKKFGVVDQVDHRRLVIPGYAAPLSGKIEDATGWKVLVGPRDAADLPGYLEKEWKA
ncbi:MAG: acetyl-CoA decarbonylase/synthase, complex subunit gamma [Methanoculleus sp.]|uniref:acetyl-CoA decarbonylase/synthase complex subunit gamma n=1 Tax=Methanoculleus sp. TaxID=90427 RepID=UPI001BD23D79|nr:acetyl-CoA decarbonylase/synthase complex subunit gamma [Methanoculleus sp.]MDK2889404.1 acetyl-CoA decarbonylase/synthase, complex subunit gamma [Methanoculleus sp.]